MKAESTKKLEAKIKKHEQEKLQENQQLLSENVIINQMEGLVNDRAQLIE